MKILLLGHTGYLGSYLYKFLNCDILDQRELIYNNKKYDYIINCIGKPDLEFCEENIKEGWESNVWPIIFIKNYYPHSKIINFSSYYVYDSFEICYEDSNITRNYQYTNQKLVSEDICGPCNISFRLGKLFGGIKKQNKLTDYIIDNDELILDSVKFNPTSLKQVYKIIDFEIKNNKLYGTYNLSNKGNTTHYYYGVTINKILGTNKKIEKSTKIFRMFHNYGNFLMSTNKIERMVNLAHWENDLESYLEGEEDE